MENDLPEYRYYCLLCSQIEFMEYKCNHCNRSFCSKHISNHECVQNKKLGNDEKAPKIKKICTFQNCNTKITLTNEFICKKCNKLFCLNHRFEESHECLNLNMKKNEKKIVINNIYSKNPKKRKTSFFCCYKSK